MAQVRVPTSPQPVDPDLGHTGRAVTASKADLIGDLANHQHAQRRRMGHCCVYQRDQANTTRGLPPHGDNEHMIYHPVSQSCSHLFVSIVTQGATQQSPVARLRIFTSTDAVGVLTNEVTARNAPAGDAEVTGTEHHYAIVSVTPGTFEEVRICQEDASSVARILGINVQELPIPRLNSAVHAGVYDKNQNTGGQNITDTKYDDLPLAVQRVRTKHKKVGGSCYKYVRTSSSTFVDAYTKSLANRLRRTTYPSPFLPEASPDPVVAIAIRVRAQSLGAAGSVVRFAFTSGNIDVTLTNTNLQTWSATGFINRASELLSVQFHRAGGAGTFVDLYGWCWAEQEEVA